MIDVIVLGYLAVLRRLEVKAYPSPPIEGTTGRLLAPTLTCDAPLVGFALAARGRQVAAALSHPGAEMEGRAASTLASQIFSPYQAGPVCGTPFELQIVQSNGGIHWFSDPEPGLRSLLDLDAAMPEARCLYVDAYPWLEYTVAPIVERMVANMLFVNLGNQPIDGIDGAIERWRRRSGGRLIVQISQGGYSGNLIGALETARRARRHGADFAIVTAGSAGLAIAADRGEVRVPAIDATPFIDSSGAGAAVAVAVIDGLLSSHFVDVAAMGMQAAEAGRQQCMLAGALDATSRALWAGILVEHGGTRA